MKRAILVGLALLAVLFSVAAILLITGKAPAGLTVLLNTAPIPGLSRVGMVKSAKGSETAPPLTPDEAGKLLEGRVRTQCGTDLVGEAAGPEIAMAAVKAIGYPAPDTVKRISSTKSGLYDWADIWLPAISPRIKSYGPVKGVKVIYYYTYPAVGRGPDRVHTAEAWWLRIVAEKGSYGMNIDKWDNGFAGTRDYAGRIRGIGFRFSDSGDWSEGWLDMNMLAVANGAK